MFGLLGPNGAGKSTTVKILTTLSQATSGRATVAGFDVTRQPRDVRHAIGSVAQKAAVDPQATGLENIVLAGRLYGMRGEPLRRRAHDLLERFDLTESANRIVRTYSGGMARRLDVAMGLVHRPAVLFLDEPTTGLDPQARASMWEEIRRLSGGDGLTVLLTTHYLDEADALAGRLAIVDRGQIVAAGTPDELKDELKGDGLQVELAAGPSTPRQPCSPRWPGSTACCPRCAWTGGCCGPAPPADRPPCRPCSPPSTTRGSGVAAVRMARPSLDDVYLRHAGRAYATAGTDPHRRHRMTAQAV